MLTSAAVTLALGSAALVRRARRRLVHAAETFATTLGPNRRLYGDHAPKEDSPCSPLY